MCYPLPLLHLGKGLSRRGYCCSASPAVSAASYLASLLRRKEYAAQPWKNGLGVTHEIAIKDSDGSSSEPKAPFDWRLSMAELRSPGGAFSRIPGVDRTIVLLEGTGVALSVNEEPPVGLKLHDPFQFPGDVTTEATVGSSTGLDLNCMVDRCRYGAEVRCLGVAPGLSSTWQSPDDAETIFVIAVEDDTRVEVEADSGSSGAAQTFVMGLEDSVRLDAVESAAAVQGSPKIHLVAGKALSVGLFPKR